MCEYTEDNFGNRFSPLIVDSEDQIQIANFCHKQ